MRFETYMDIKDADLIGLSGWANAIQVLPAAGVTQDELKQTLFNQFGVASVQPVSMLIRTFEDLLSTFIGIFLVIQVAAIALAFLIVYSSTSINLDERAREVATMFAFGLRVRTILRLAIIENLLTGILGTVLGCGLGYLFMITMIVEMLASDIPDINVTITIHLFTFGAAMLLTVLVAVLTPILSLRKLLRMDIPSTLRVME